jgi:hypothetical protein
MPNWTFKRLLAFWLFMLVFLFVGMLGVFALLQPTVPAWHVALIALLASTLTTLPHALSLWLPIRRQGEGAAGTAARSLSFGFYACLLEAVGGLVLAIALPSWWKLAGAATALVGFWLASLAWKGSSHSPIQ